ncbi:MAG: glycosyltransferase family 2 protein [Phycisphaerae bacterium]
MLVSFIIASHNRREVVLNTLQQLRTTARPSRPFEAIVVDNASVDATPDAIRRAFPEVILVPLRRNLGSCAKAYGADRAHGEYIVFLDDDSHPTPGSVDRMIGHLRADPDLGAAGFRVVLPDGREECSALPNVFIGCGVGFRAAALREVGGLDLTLFMAAEEYDLSFRLINAGWGVRTFDDICVNHLKTPCARRHARPVYYDTRNNILVAARYLPDACYPAIRRDWSRRYAWMAASEHRIAAHCRASLVGRILARRDRPHFAARRLSPVALETLFRFRWIEERLQVLHETGVRRIVFADLGKNILAFHRAANAAGVRVVTIADDRFAAPGRGYRGIPIRPVADALALEADAVVVSNTSPVHARLTRDALATRTTRPVYAWFASAPILRPACHGHARVAVPPPAPPSPQQPATCQLSAPRPSAAF